MYRKSQSSNAVSTGAVGIKGVSPVDQSSEAAVLVMERAGDSLAFHSTPPFTSPPSTRDLSIRGHYQW